MKYDIEALKFGGMIVGVAEDELSASVTDDKEGAFTAMLYDQYKAAGAPKNKRQWVRDELRKYFLFVKKPPVWIEKTTIPRWPFLGGKPMVFIEQIEVPENEVTNSSTSPDVVLYVFGGRQPDVDFPDCWQSVYRVVEQVRGL